MRPGTSLVSTSGDMPAIPFKMSWGQWASSRREGGRERQRGAAQQRAPSTSPGELGERSSHANLGPEHDDHDLGVGEGRPGAEAALEERAPGKPVERRRAGLAAVVHRPAAAADGRKKRPDVRCAEVRRGNQGPPRARGAGGAPLEKKARRWLWLGWRRAAAPPLRARLLHSTGADRHPRPKERLESRGHPTCVPGSGAQSSK